ncbi:MAG: histidine kinase [Hyphomicrobiales bacterium]|jgi:hypothetical protein|nr:histidine kinase [Hyphomicrobiales bacterium]
MFTLVRLLIVCGIIAGIAFGGMFALAEFVQPQQREMTFKIPRDQLP